MNITQGLITIAVTIIGWAVIIVLAGVLGFLAEAAPFLVGGAMIYCVIKMMMSFGKSSEGKDNGKENKNE